MNTDLRHPVGRFVYDKPFNDAERAGLIDEIEAAPGVLRLAFDALSETGVETPYRPDGWTARQVVHHVAESHMHSYLRFKFAMAQDEPTIMPYDEAVWATQPDVYTTDPRISLALLAALHQRWVAFLRTMRPGDWQRAFRHPENGLMTLDKALGLYAWHGRHHAAHLRMILAAGHGR